MVTSAPGTNRLRASADDQAPVAGSLSGAPLDLVKVAAAAFMLGDHINTILLNGDAVLLWRLGRIAFPLFCLVTAVHLARGADPRRYLILLLAFAAPTQPIFAWAFAHQLGNVLLTLAAGAALGIVLPRLVPWLVHATFAAAVALALWAPFPARSGVDFGTIGMLLPAAMVLTLRFGGAYVLWLPVLLFCLNLDLLRPAEGPWWAEPMLDGLFATVGTLVTLGVAALFRGWPRFLPRYALYLFYPVHLAVLSTARAFL